jgi:Ca-activated chloride channel family protein
MRGRPTRLALAAASAAVLLICLPVSPVMTPLWAQQTQPFRSSAHTVAVYATVLESNGHLATGLKKEDFTVFDNGKPQDISVFVNEVQPITMVAMLDLSGSMTGNLPLLRAAAAQLAAHLLPADKARFGGFGDRISIATPDFTNNINDLIRNLWEDLDPGGQTPLWAAVNTAMSALSRQEGRRVVLVFTDGYDTSPRYVNGLADDIRRAQEEDFMIYAVGLSSSDGNGRFGGGAYSRRGGRGGGYSGDRAGPDPGLKSLAEETGGGYFELKSAEELDATFTRVAEELHHQYILGFNPALLDGKVHTIDVRITSPNLTARARRSYLAAPDK